MPKPRTIPHDALQVSPVPESAASQSRPQAVQSQLKVKSPQRALQVRLPEEMYIDISHEAVKRRMTLSVFIAFCFECYTASQLK